MKTYVIIPVYNRVKTTLRCLKRLSSAGVFDWAHVVVIDDASPDNTGKEVRNLYPSDHVTVLEGDGNLWWAGGIKMGMEYAYKNGADYFIWLNDDCRPRKSSAIQLLLNSSAKNNCISVGTVVCTSGVIFAGMKKSFFGKKPLSCKEDEIIDCDTFGGNAVCIPRFVVDRIGFPDAKNFPMMADTDYGFSASKKGIRIVVIGDALFDNDDNLNLEHESFLLSDKPTKQLLKATFLSIKSFYYLPSFYKMRIKHYGIIRGNLMVIWVLGKYSAYIFLRMFVPRKMRIKKFGKYLEAWKIQSYYINKTKEDIK